MDDSGLENLRAVVRERAAKAADVAAKGGSVPQEEIDSLRNLSDLCGTLESTAVKPKANRWIPGTLFLLALICASILLFRRVAATQVEIDATATSAEFRLAQTRPLTEAVVVTSLRLVGIKRLSDMRCAGMSAEHPPKDLTLIAGSGATPGSITLQPIEARKGLSVTVLGGDSPTHWALAFSGAPQTVRATFEGSLKIDGEPCRIEARFPRTLEATLDEKSSRLVLEFAKAPGQFLLSLLPVDRLAFVRSDVVDLEGRVEQQQSTTLTGGSIYFEDLEGKETKLRDGEWLEIGVRQGWLLAPCVAGGNLAWRYRGSVHALRSGPPDSSRDLKPSWLEYARAQHGIELLWGAALSLFGLGGTLVRWFKT